MAKFIHSDLGMRSRGDVVEVTLSAGANVRLLDSLNFDNYRRGRQHRFYGGRATQSPVRIPIPSNNHWHAVVDMQGLRGSVRASFRVINGASLEPLPPIQQRATELSRIAENAVHIGTPADARQHDVFLSYASEDRDTVAEPLARALEGHGLEVWYDKHALRIGDSLRRRIDEGISNSRFGIVILSKAYLAKPWPQHELDGLVVSSVENRQVLLPIWHELSKEDVIRASPSLADKIALKTSDYTIDQIAAEVAAVVQQQSAP